MDPFTTASELLGDLELTPGQLAHLRALDRKYAQRLHGLLHKEGKSKSELSQAEAEDLQRRLVADILDMLTPEQRRVVKRP